MSPDRFEFQQAPSSPLRPSPQAEANSNAAISAAGMGTWSWNPVSGDEICDSRMLELLQGPRRLLECLEEVERARLTSAIASAQTNGFPFDLVLELRSSERPVRFLRLRGGLKLEDPTTVLAVCFPEATPSRVKASDSEPSANFTGAEQHCNCQVSDSITKMRQSEARLAESQRIANLGSWELDCRKNELIWSDEVFRIFEFERCEGNLTFEKFLNAVHPEDREMLTRAYSDSLATRQDYQLTHRLKMTDGRTKWVQERCTTEYDATGAPVRSVGTVQDVTTLAIYEQALLAANKRLCDIFDAFFGFVGVLSVDGTLTEVNQAPFETAGLSRVELIGKPFWEVPWWSDSIEMQDQLRDALRRAAAGEIVRFESAIRATDNNLFIIDIAFRPLRDAAGSISDIICFAIDITERKRIEYLLRQSKQSLSSILDAVPAQIAVLDEDGVITLANRAWVDFAAMASLNWRQVTRGSNYLDACERAVGHSATEAHAIATCIRQVIAGDRKEFTIKYECFCAGSAMWFLCRGRTFLGQSGERVILVHTDITVVEQAEQQLEEMRSQLAHAVRVATMGEMATGIAHELNQPLSALSLYAEGCLGSVQTDTWSPEILCEKLTSITNLARCCGQIVRSLRSFVTRHQTAYVCFDVRDCFFTVLAIVQHELTFARIRCSLEISPYRLPMVGDPVQIQQVILNLIRNAIEAHSNNDPESGRIEISAVANDREEIEISIRDCGAGITPEVMSQLFDPFFTTKPAGMGMGLKISRSIVRAHGGSLTCESRPQFGTIFRVTLPAADEDSASE